MEIKVEENRNPLVLPEERALGFGKYFTAHMFLMDYDEGIGWHDKRIVPFDKISLHPAATVLHYGAEIFEGLKAYRTANGGIYLFRPIENVRRLNRSAERLCLPTVEEDEMLEILEFYTKHEAECVPRSFGASLYLRPCLLGNDESLGVHTVKKALFMIIASPSGSYYKNGISPLSIMIEDKDVRTVRGGTGYAKCGGNYAASIRAAERASEHGYSQVLWLDGVERKYIEEVGAMNVMFKIGGEIVTPTLDGGSILPGITRKSCIELLRDTGYTVSERLISVEELISVLKDGSLEEAFGCGTAAVIAPIGKLMYRGEEYTINGGKIGDVTRLLYDTLTGIQWGKIRDTYGWMYQVT